MEFHDSEKYPLKIKVFLILTKNEYVTRMCYTVKESFQQKEDVARWKQNNGKEQRGQQTVNTSEQ